MSMQWRRSARWAGALAVAGGIFFAGMWAARAVPGGPVRRSLSFAGTITGRTGPQMLTFTFRKGSASVCAPMVQVTPEAPSGAFSTEIPLTSCPSALFDGDDVTVEVSVGGTVIASAQPINPVPYAVYAERLGTPDCPNGYERATDAMLPTTALLCRRGNDQVVRVGSGSSAFWMDRFLNSVWTGRDGTGTRLDDMRMAPMDIVGGGTADLFPVSMVGVPTTGYVSVFQGSILCRTVGKRLPTVDELIAASRNFPGLAPPAGRRIWSVRPDECPGARNFDYNAGSTPQCVSYWGVEQLLGYRQSLAADIVVRGTDSYPIYGTAYLRASSALVGATDITDQNVPTVGNQSSGLRCVTSR